MSDTGSVMAVAHTWNMDTVWQVRRLFSEAHVDKALIASGGPDVLEVTCARLARHFIENARALAVEVNAEDLRFERCESELVPFTVRMLAHWEPSTNAVELRGGQPDGQVVAVQHIGEPLRVPVERAFDWRTAGPEDFAPTSDILVYEMSGWNERERHWVYELRD